MVSFILNGKTVQGEEGQHLLEVAEKHGIEIPTLCHHKALEPAGMCRLCTVEMHHRGRVRYVTACNYPIWEGMEIKTDTEAVHKGRKLIVELLLARCPDVPILQKLAKQYGIEAPRFKTAEDTCILCGLCTRICERMGNSGAVLRLIVPHYTSSHGAVNSFRLVRKLVPLLRAMISSVALTFPSRS